jgi:hypothetical protein
LFFSGRPKPLPEAAVPEAELQLPHQGQEHVLPTLRHQLHRGQRVAVPGQKFFYSTGISRRKKTFLFICKRARLFVVMWILTVLAL